jgi:hypothetical protein
VVPQNTLLSFTDVPKSQTLIPLKSQKTEGIRDESLLLPEGFPTFRLKTLRFTCHWKPEQRRSGILQVRFGVQRQSA